MAPGRARIRFPGTTRYNNPVIDFALHMSDLDPKATWGLTTIAFGLHRMPCQREPGAPQNLVTGCVPENAQLIQFQTPQLFCPSTTLLNANSCGKKQPTAWACPAVQDTPTGRPLPFSCTATPTADGKVTYNCASPAIDSVSIPASSCSYTAKSCP